MSPDHYLSSEPGQAFDERSIHASAQVAGHDVIVDVYRAYAYGTHSATAPLGRFRLSGIDGGVVVEPPAGVAAATALPEAADGVPYRGCAQRLSTRTHSDLDPLSLVVPLPHAGSALGARTTVLGAAGSVLGEWAQVTPTERVVFDATQPFVFEDAQGSYWVTYRPEPFLGDIAFSGSYSHGIDTDIKIAPPAVGSLPAGQVSVLETAAPPFRSSHDTGADALMGARTLQQIRSTGKMVVSINGTPTDLAATTFAVRSTVEVADVSGESVYGVRFGTRFGADGHVDVALRYTAVEVLSDPTLFTEGFHLLRTPRAKWRFETFFHPHVATLRAALNQYGPFGLLQPPIGPDGSAGPLAEQDLQPATTLAGRYATNAMASTPADDLDFSAGGAYSLYNWELFFHAPTLIATRLHEAGRFEEALKWLRTVFDPYRPAQAGAEDDAAVRSVWRFRPFREAFPDGEMLPRNIQELVALLSSASDDEAGTSAGNSLLQQIRNWRRNPFDPHAIARTRIVAYMTWVVTKYLEILLDWGDQLFTRDTLESIGEATEYYLMAARILGVRPEAIEASPPGAPETFGEMLERFQTGDTAVVRVEEALALATWSTDELEAATDDATSLATLLHFCVPANPDLKAKLWDRVADRLFKVRNCLDIQGRKRELALFEPPIDPDLLVRAAAAGADLQSAMAEIVTGRIPHRRYLAMADLAAGLAGSANALGQALLAAIEKRDADQLNTLRAEHERRLHEDAIQARRDQVADLEHQLAALRLGREATERRFTYYKNRRMNANERKHLEKTRGAKSLSDMAGVLTGTAAILNLIPELDIGSAGAGGSPKVTFAFGGRSLAAFARGTAQAIEAGAQALDREGRLAATEAGYERRTEDWVLQADVAEKELAATDRRILGTEIQVAMAKNALASAELRMEQIDAVEDFLKRRFARDELFTWLADKLSTLHFQSYQLAYEFAKKAESAWRFELGRSDSFIQFGYWDSRRRGLLAADTLGHDLRRMQVAYTELSSRRLEVDQTFSLRDIDPLALLRMQRGGVAQFDIPEAFFDLYYPGHFGRRIRAVRFTIPAVVPPNTNLPAHVEILRHRIRKVPDRATDALVEAGYGNAPVSMTATSSGQRDAGVFELDFKGPKLLPFEGAGAVSRWRIQLPSRVRPFKYSGIQDVLVHVAYDAEYDGTLRAELDPPSASSPVLAALFTPVRRRVISLKQEHGAALRRFVQAARQEPTPPAEFIVTFKIDEAALAGYWAEALKQHDIEIDAVRLVVVGTAGDLELTLNDQAHASWGTWDEVADLPAAGFADPDVVFAPGSAPGHGFFGTHTLAVENWGDVDPADDFDILIVLDFKVAP